MLNMTAQHIEQIDGLFLNSKYNSDILPINVAEYSKWIKLQAKLDTFNWKLYYKYHPTCFIKPISNFLTHIEYYAGGQR